MDTANPYAAFDDYWKAGWRGILPLPPRAKKTPPDGYTGYQGAYPSYPDCHAWAEDGPRNICLRMPDNVVGIDVDHYDSKRGGDTLADLVGKHGPLPPTWLSTSRDDGISGIRFYRVPPGTVLPTKLPGIEFIQLHHRYAVVWPSEHPDTGRNYRWVDETDPANTSGVPNVDALPFLPAAWVNGLQTESKATDKADVDMARILAVIDAMPTGEPCIHIRAGAGRATAGGDRHDSYNEAVLAVASAGRDGCPGAKEVLRRLRATFIAEVTQPGTSSQRTPGEAAAEWSRSLTGAIAIIADRTQGAACPDDVLEWLSEQDAAAQAPPGDDTAGDADPDDSIDEGQRAYDLAVARKAAELRILDDAKDRNAARIAETARPLEGIALHEFLAQPDEDVRYRVDGLWGSNGRVLFVAAAKAGKTTVVSRNLIPCLTGGGDFLGKFATQPVDGTVVYLNLEVGEGTLRAWMRNAGIPNPDRVVVVNLRGRVGALNLSSAHGRARFARFLRDNGAEVVIADPLAPLLAAHNLSEDDNPSVAKFFSWWSEAMADGNVTDDLICHHSGHEGKRSRGASRLLDEPDAVWTITKAQASVNDDDILAADDRRFITCYGRDVELAESGLDFDPATGRITIADGSGSELKRKGQERGYERAVIEVMESKGGNSLSQNDIVKARGNEQRMRAALRRLIESGDVIEINLGRGRGSLHSLNKGVSPVATGSAGDTATGGVARPYRGDTTTSGKNQEPATPPAEMTLSACESCGLPAITSPCSTCRGGAQ